MISSELLSLIAGAFLSIIFSYVRGVSVWYDSRDPMDKRLIMLGFLLVTAIAIFVASCEKLTNLVTCDQAGALGLVRVFIMALMSNQATFLISPRREHDAAKRRVTARAQLGLPPNA